MKFVFYKISYTYFEKTVKSSENGKKLPNTSTNKRPFLLIKNPFFYSLE